MVSSFSSVHDSLTGSPADRGAASVETLVAREGELAGRDGEEGLSELTQDQAIEIADENASFGPCPQCSSCRFATCPEASPCAGFWGVVLSDKLDSDGEPNRTESFLVDVATGHVSPA